MIQQITTFLSATERKTAGYNYTCRNDDAPTKANKVKVRNKVS